MKTKVSGDSFCVMLEHDGLGAGESHRDSGRYDGGTHYWLPMWWKVGIKL